MKKVVTVLLTLLLVISGAGAMLACKDKNVDNGAKTLKEAYKDYFSVGAALSISTDGKFLYENEMLSEFNSFTAENEMKWKYIQAQKGVFTFSQGDALINKAREVGAKVRGHALVWRSSTPDYLLESGITKSKMLEEINNHVLTTVDHFNTDDDMVYAWDVVNEAISDSNDPNEIYYKCQYYDVAGEDYIFEAFKAARRADPDVKLFYNDYNLNQPVKRAKAIAMIKKMQEQGIPIDGVGEQGHYSIRNFNVDEFRAMFDDFRELGLEVHLTELDLSIYAKDSDSQIPLITDELANLQGEVAKQMFEVMRENKDIITNVTFWGVADDHTWLDDYPVRGRKNHPLPFDVFSDPKPMYYAIRDFKKTGYSYDADKKDNPQYNIYDGKGETFHFGNWFPGVQSGIEVEPLEVGGEAVTEIYYFKSEAYLQAQAKIHGPLKDFRYLNLTLSANKALLLMAQLNYPIGFEDNYDRVIGEEGFSVDAAKKTYAIKLPVTAIPYLNIIDDVWLFPEPGETGNEFKGSLYVHDTWFSKTKPDGATEINPTGGGGSGVQERAYIRTGQSTWYNETTWTKYNLKLASAEKGLVDVSASGAASWGFVSVQLDEFENAHNMLSFSYIDNHAANYASGSSVEYIRFRLRGAPKGMTSDGINTYMEYHDQDVYDWVFDEATVVRDAETKVITIKINISEHVDKLLRSNAIDMDDYGLRLVILIESVGTEYTPKYPENYSDPEKVGKNVEHDRRFNITVTDVNTYKDDNEETVTNYTDFTTNDIYKLSSNEAGTELTVKYTSVPSANSNIVKEMSAATAAGTYSMTVKNNSSHAVSVRLNYKIGENGDYTNAEVILQSGATQTLSVGYAVGTTTIILFIDSTEGASGVAGGELFITLMG